MSKLNPYDSFLDDRPPQDILASTPGALASVLAAFGPDKVSTPPAPGKWSPAEIVCHLADCETVFAFRLRQALAEPNHVIQPFDQDGWSKTYPKMTAQAALDVFAAVRRWNLALLGTLSPEDFARKLSHPERGEMTLQTIVETMGGHDLNHLSQVETIAAQK